MDSEGALTVPGTRGIFAGVSGSTEGAGLTGSSAGVASPAAVLGPRPGSPRRIGGRWVTVIAGLALLALAACGTAGSPAGGGPAAPPPGQGTSLSAGPAGLSLVAIGDSIPYNSPDDCPGCTGFVDQYAKAVEKATGRHVSVQNLSQHTGLTLPQLLGELGSFKQPLSAADVILVGIAHNSFELNADAPCGRPVINETPVWPVVNARCATKSAAKYQPMYQKLYSQIAAWRDGKPTILRTINRYSDWIGFAGAAPDPRPGPEDQDDARRLGHDALLGRDSERVRLRGHLPRLQRTRRDEGGSGPPRAGLHTPLPTRQRHHRERAGGARVRTPGLTRQATPCANVAGMTLHDWRRRRCRHRQVPALR